MGSIAAAALLIPPALAPPAADLNSTVYECRVLGDQAIGQSLLTITVRGTPREGAESESWVRVEIRPDNPRFPTVQGVRVPERLLLRGDFTVVTAPGGPNGVDIMAPRTGYELMLPSQHSPGNGYVHVMADGPGEHFEVAGYHPIAAGVCVPRSREVVR